MATRNERIGRLLATGVAYASDPKGSTFVAGMVAGICDAIAFELTGTNRHDDVMWIRDVVTNVPDHGRIVMPDVVVRTFIAEFKKRNTSVNAGRTATALSNA